MICPKCAEWGATVPASRFSIRCSDCGRHTWPNLGVNVPAGCAVALAHRGIEHAEVPVVWEEGSVQAYGGMSELLGRESEVGSNDAEDRNPAGAGGAAKDSQETDQNPDQETPGE